MSVVKRGQQVEDFGDFCNSVIDDTSREGYVANWGAKEVIARRRSAWNTAIERVICVDVRREIFAAPNE